MPGLIERIKTFKSIKLSTRQILEPSPLITCQLTRTTLEKFINKPDSTATPLVFRCLSHAPVIANPQNAVGYMFLLVKLNSSDSPPARFP